MNAQIISLAEERRKRSRWAAMESQYESEFQRFFADDGTMYYVSWGQSLVWSATQDPTNPGAA